METIKMGKRGTVVLPAKLRKRFGLEAGALLITEERDGEIRLRPAYV
jgi:AbrB family looped-hinge helix DNA binding protein